MHERHHREQHQERPAQEGREARPFDQKRPAMVAQCESTADVVNAVDFAREAVTVTWRWDDQTVALTVLDDGAGFRKARS